ncbi:MAG: 7-cyano-7-deazaguanine synthase [Candidatus Delongbacteria bacterium]|nr:7-cyano-7-deazaguanine synthase [Candidatus Delongbacteria bacterium]
MQCLECLVQLEDTSSQSTCSSCIAYQRNFDKTIISREFDDFYNSTKNNKGVCIVELSGGKDSLVTLYLLKKKLKLNPIAVTFDNGFIPESIIKNAKKICRKLNVRYIIAYSNLSKNIKHKAEENICSICNSYINRIIISIASRYGINWSVNGENKYRRLNPYVTSLGQISAKVSNNDEFVLNTINLPFAMRLKKKESDNILKTKLNWKKPSIKFCSSNCLAYEIIYSKFPKSNDQLKKNCLENLSAEIRSGFLTREEATQIFSEDGPQSNFNSKLSLTDIENPDNEILITFDSDDVDANSI